MPRNKYTEIRADKPANKEQATRPEFKTCKYTTEAIVSEGIDKGELRKVCTEPTCPVHHPRSRSQKVVDDPKWKAEQEKQRRELPSPTRQESALSRPSPQPFRCD